VRVVTLPNGEDPDTFVRTHGGAALTAQLGDAIDVFERKIQILERMGWLSELQKKRKALDRLLPTIRATSDDLMRDLYISRASEATGVAREVLEREVRGPAPAAAPPFGGTPAPRISPAARVRRGERRARYTEVGASAEREIVRAMLTSRSRVEQLAEKIGVESFRDPHYRDIYKALIAAGSDATIEQVTSHLDEETIPTVEEMLGERAPEMDAERTISDSLAALRARDLDQRLADIDRLVPLANVKQKDELIAEKQEIMKELQGTGKKHYKAFRQRRAR
jgi:DNA primase